MELLISMFTAVCIISTFVQESGSWPEGTYGLPMPDVGCPLTYTFSWEEGSRTQKTQPESHAMEGNHLAGIDATKDEPTDKLTSSFCIKTSHPKDGDWEWEEGRYCIFKKDKCPRDFEYGWIYWDDSVPIVGSMQGQGTSGTIPDGDYGRNTQIDFCCRKDGYAHHEISLPTDSPFYLLRYGDACQQVEDMQVTEEWVYWAGTPNVNWDGQDGVYPYVERSSFPQVFTRMFYCYYQPNPRGRKRASYSVLIIFCIGISVLMFPACAYLILWVLYQFFRQMYEQCLKPSGIECWEAIQECYDCCRTCKQSCRDECQNEWGCCLEENEGQEQEQSQQEPATNETEAPNKNNSQTPVSTVYECPGVKQKNNANGAVVTRQPLRSGRVVRVRNENITGRDNRTATDRNNEVHANANNAQEVTDQDRMREAVLARMNETTEVRTERVEPQPPENMEPDVCHSPIPPRPTSLPPTYEEVMASTFETIDTHV